jgi:phage FluMu protein Com
MVMPKGKVPRYKIIRCRTCGKIIRKFDRYKYPRHHVPKEDILAAIRRHYKRNHPRKFREFVEKALRTKRKKGLIDKKR